MRTHFTKRIALGTAFIGLLSSFHHEGGGLEHALTGKSGLRWLVAGSTTGPEGDCESNGRYITFIRKGALVKEELCEDGAQVTRSFTYEVGWGNQGEQISFNGVVYTGRQLPSSAQVCEGSTRCVRLSTLNMDKMDRSTDIYLIRPTNAGE